MENQTGILIYQTEDGNTKITRQPRKISPFISRIYMMKKNWLWSQLVRNTYKFELKDQEKWNAVLNTIISN